MFHYLEQLLKNIHIVFECCRATATQYVVIVDNLAFCCCWCCWCCSISCSQSNVTCFLCFLLWPTPADNKALPRGWLRTCTNARRRITNARRFVIEFRHCCECVQIVTICALLARRCLPGRQKRLGPRGKFIKKLFREHIGRRQGLWRLRNRLPKNNAIAVRSGITRCSIKTSPTSWRRR